MLHKYRNIGSQAQTSWYEYVINSLVKPFPRTYEHGLELLVYRIEVQTSGFLRTKVIRKFMKSKNHLKSAYTVSVHTDLH